MTLDINELERLIAGLHSFADDIEDEACVRGEVTPDEIALLRKSAAVLKAAEEMREVLKSAPVVVRITASGSCIEMAEDTTYREAALAALAAYDAASRPISATSADVATGEVDNGATS